MGKWIGVLVMVFAAVLFIVGIVGFLMEKSYGDDLVGLALLILIIQGVCYWAAGCGCKRKDCQECNPGDQKEEKGPC